MIFRNDFVPGKNMLTDLFYSNVNTINKETGEIIKPWILVAILGYSKMTYAEALENIDSDSCFSALSNAMNYFRGVPETIVVDNSSCFALAKCFANKYQINIQLPSLRLPTPYSVIIKRKIDCIHKLLRSKLVQMSFIPLPEMNSTIKGLLNIINDSTYNSLQKSNRDIFESYELNTLRTLPVEPHKSNVWKVRKVNIDSHLELDGRYYSVSGDLIGRQVDVNINQDRIEVYFEGKKVTEHLQVHDKARYITKCEHMVGNKAFRKYSSEDFISWASKIGQNTAKVIKTILENEKYPEHGYRKCLGILSFVRKKGREKLENACKKALEKRTPRYISVKTFLQEE